MEDMEVAGYWNENAPVWTILTRAGYDIYRDQLNTPSFLQLLPEIKGLKGIDVGCGEGHHTRLLKSLGADICGLDIAENFISAARKAEKLQPMGIEYIHASACRTPFSSNTFDFVTAFMCLMDISDFTGAIKEIYRILQPGGFMQFSIAHPCFTTPHRRNLRNNQSVTYAIETGGYFAGDKVKVEEWIFGSLANDSQKYRKFKIPVFYRTLSEWINALTAVGFHLEMMNEPAPDAKLISAFPSLQDAQVVAYFLHIRCRKVLL